MDCYSIDGDPIAYEEWAKTGTTPVEQTAIPLEGGEVRVSTVHLGLDHNHSKIGPPLIFETMLFTDSNEHPLCYAMTRYSTVEDARRGHEEAVSALRSCSVPTWASED